MNMPVITPGLSAIEVLDLIPEWKGTDENGKFSFIKEDCLARLIDVRRTNKNAHSLSAFVSILTFVGYLAKLAFGRVEELKSYVQNGCGLDQVQFQAFCDCYLLSDAMYQNRINKPGLSYLLYKFVRCGLVHGATLLNTRSSTQQLNVKIFLSHKMKHKATLKELDQKILNASNTSGVKLELTLNAFVLCRELEQAIQRMFSNPPQMVRESIMNVFVEETPILCYHGKDVK